MNRIVEITALSNGAHRNQSWDGDIPPVGWAMIPEDMETPDTFPFVEIEVEEVSVMVDGGEEPQEVKYMVVTSITAGVMPEPAPTPEPEPEKNVWDELDAAYQEGVNTAYDQ